MKPIVRCKLLDDNLPIIGKSMFIVPINHPNHKEGHRVSNNHIALTSPVVNVDKQHKKFETQNTIYQY